MNDDLQAQEIRDQVRAAYGAIARDGGSCCGPATTCCNGAPADALAERIGYSPEELAALPDGVSLGLSCGNPNALAALQRGEFVIDLGTQGRGFLSELFLGSVAHNVAQHAPLPVLFVPVPRTWLRTRSGA